MQLTLADELLLLALPEEGGRALVGSTELDCGVAGLRAATQAAVAAAVIASGASTAAGG
ncbi:hypothetical protein NE236_13800 [Actinoallomurus purpureus]|uniref:hypothetical protein n=1 Tax=Actinoallomurus purpureus TaxID=478114 RepID=UPI0020920280|nr:hypothetical protein [Actinoallomurus purpureus]MCO6006062.1 hypothetical protein [Actinoallomurus purpureus]